MSAFDTSLPFPTGGTGSISRNTFGSSKEPRALGYLGKENHRIRSENIQAAISYVKRDESHKKPEQKRNMMSLLLFKMAILGLAPGEDGVDIINRLVRNGADIHVKNTFGSTPLMMACLFGNIEIIQTLLQYPNVVNDKDNANRTALDYISTNDPTAYIHIKQILNSAKKYPIESLAYSFPGAYRAPIAPPASAAGGAGASPLPTIAAVPSSTASVSSKPSSGYIDILNVKNKLKKINKRAWDEIYGIVALTIEHPSKAAEEALLQAWSELSTKPPPKWLATAGRTHRSVLAPATAKAAAPTAAASAVVSVSAPAPAVAPAAVATANNSPLPAGWTIHTAEDGRVYYYNADLNETQWDRPLSGGWTKHTAPDGRVYYHKKATGETQWDTPANISAAGGAASRKRKSRRNRSRKVRK